MANLFTNPENFSAGWSNTAITVSADSIEAPDGTMTADKCTSQNLGTLGSCSLTQTVTVSTSTQYTLALFAKADQIDWIALAQILFTTPANSWSYFDAANGAEGTISANMDDFGIEAFPNGWYRPHVVFTTDSSDTSGLAGFYLATANNTISFTRNGSQSLYVWGASLNVGSAPEPYVSQAGITVTNSTPKLIRGVTRNVTRNVTKNLIDF